MEIGNDDLDYTDEISEVFDSEEDFSSYEQEAEDSKVEEDSSDFISELLKTKGIEDRDKIKFENEDGEIEEVNWDSLSNADKMNIINSDSDDTMLEDSEIQLINAIRDSKLSPAEYIQAIQQQGIDQYLQNTVDPSYSYRVDDLNDEELFIADVLTRSPEMTDEEVFELLDRVKQNDALFKKQIGAIRAEYIKAEQDSIRQAEFEQQQLAQEQYHQFASSIENSILNFTEFSGCDLNMGREDMQYLYNFITGVDAAGVSHIGKALNDPNRLVRMAWFDLYGEQMINDINEYYKREITNVRKESYNKGLQEKQDKPYIVHKNVQSNDSKKNNQFFYDDLD